MLFHQRFLPSRFVDILVTHVLHFHWGGGGMFPFTGNAYLQCNKTLTDKEKVRKKNKMRLSKSSPALYALKGKHAQCVDSE